MTKRNRMLEQAGPFVAGVLIGSSAVTPAFAATLDAEALQPYLLLGSLIVLLSGLILRATVNRRPVKSALHAPVRDDLRTLKVDPTVDIAMPAQAAH